MTLKPLLRLSCRCSAAMGSLLLAFACHAQSESAANQETSPLKTVSTSEKLHQTPWRTSCATSTCHGGIEGRGPAWNHSLSTWMARDPHVGAGRLLRDADSRAIVERLAGDSTKTDPGAYDNVLRTRCISCHTSATAEDCQASGILEDGLLQRGVNCESCHGSSEKWLEPHLHVDWSGPGRFDASTGMRDTESISGRTATCVRCHVGSRTEDGVVRDMNHDLIAAGHPALRFDLLLYNDNLPKHWDSQSDAEQQFAESAVRVRQVSRAISLAAAATLASERAADHLQEPALAPWPELSDYDCFACHQSLTIREYDLPARSLGQTKSPLHVSDGLPVWNAWHTVGNELEMRENRRALETLSPHLSDPNQVKGLAEGIAERFRAKADQRLESLQTAEQISAAATKTIESVRTQLSASEPYDWHQAAIQYLDLEAAARDLARAAATEARGRQLLESLPAIERLLRFEVRDRSSDGGRLHSPASFQPGGFRDELLNLLKNGPSNQDQANQDQANQDPANQDKTDHSASVAHKT